MSDEALLWDREKFASAADYAYATLRREIVEGRFAPGRRMREIELAQRLGISRTPTRQALSRLELEGLLALRPRSGLVVSVLDMDAVEELYEMRSALEGTAAAMAARHASPRDLALLAKLLDDETGLGSDPVSLYRHNRQLHEAIHVAAHNRYLEKSLHALQDAIALLGPTTLAAQDRPVIAHGEHATIIQAIVARDPDTADRLARAHILGALDVRRAIIAREQSLDAGLERDSG
jgi:DNA-binding GntR family transcriptional regulator